MEQKNWIHFGDFESPVGVSAMVTVELESSKCMAQFCSTATQTCRWLVKSVLLCM